MRRHEEYRVMVARYWQRPGYRVIRKGDGKKPSPSCYAKKDRKEVMSRKKNAKNWRQQYSNNRRKGIEKGGNTQWQEH